MKMLAIALLVAISYAQTDVKHSSRRVLQATVPVNYWMRSVGTYSCETVSEDHPCLASQECVPEPNCPSMDGQAAVCEPAEEDGCELTEQQCIDKAEAGDCGSDPIMDTCCKRQCRVECGAEPCTCSALAPGTFSSEEYGKYCNEWDMQDISPFYDECTATDAEKCGDENWCLATWCYVLNGQCAGASESARFPGYFFSYPQCGTTDCYTCTLEEEDGCPTIGPNKCPYVPEGYDVDCDCPVFCVEDWIGDGECDRRDNGYDCRNCLSFYNDNELPDNVNNPDAGTFDCNQDTGLCDCELPQTTIYPSDLMVIDGEMYCADMIAICSDVSFQANIAERDWRSDPNNYGDLELTNRGVGRQGWFIIKILNDGDWRADLVSRRVNEDGDEVDHEIEYLMWGPYRDYAHAVNTCPEKEDDGTLTGPGLPRPDYSSDGPSGSHTIDINVDKDEGDVYIFMVSDKNEVRGTITLDAREEPGDPDTVACNLQVNDTFACEPNDLVQLNFTDSTEIVKHNLGGYWAETNPNHGQLNDVPEGIYYGNVGTYTIEDTQQLMTLGLRVDALNAGAYRCPSDGDINSCANVMTGLDTTNPDNSGLMPVYTVHEDDDDDEDHDEVHEHFGQISMEVGTVELRFTAVFDDPESTEQYRDGITLQEYEESIGGNPDKTWDRIKLSIFDIDSKIIGGEEVQFINAEKICPGGVVRSGENSHPYYLTEQNWDDYLDFSQNDYQSASGYRWDVFSGCWVRRSADDGDSVFRVRNLPNCVHAPGEDMEDEDKCRHNNPSTPQTLELMQKLMSVEAEYTNVGSEGMRVNFIVSRDHGGGSRNLWFGGESVSIGRKCCKDVITTCEHGYINPDLECTDVTGNADQCTEKNCCERPPSSHGDPIIHTFFGECYDLHKDGNYLATAHSAYDHKVYVAVYNDYIRQVSVTNLNGDVLLSVNNFGEVLNNGWLAFLKVQTLQCPKNYKKDDCVGEYINVSFDAQDLFFDVRVGMRHTYKDQALKRGEVGYHMDIIPQPYWKSFKPRRKDYSGLYFHNPLPEELPQCHY